MAKGIKRFWYFTHWGNLRSIAKDVPCMWPRFKTKREAIVAEIKKCLRGERKYSGWMGREMIKKMKKLEKMLKNEKAR